MTRYIRSVIPMLLISSAAVCDELEYRDESAYVGNGVVEWRVVVRNNGSRRICCMVDMEAPVFRFGNRLIASDRRRICVYPGNENYVSLVGVTTQLGATGKWDGGLPKDGEKPLFGGDIVEGKHGSTYFRVYQCTP